MTMKINIAIIGVGNCAKSFVEGIAFYTKHPDDTVGIMNRSIGGYTIADLQIVAAFDVDERKVGKKLHDAIVAPPNCTEKLFESPPYNIIVQRGPTEGSIIPELRDYFIQKLSDIGCPTEINGSVKERLPNNVNVFIPGIEAEQLVIELDARGIACSAGSACSAQTKAESYVIMALGYDEARAKSSVRFTLGRETTRQDLDYVLESLKEILKKYK